MNKAIAKKWVEALRSGKYLQGRSKLRVGNSFCCLGVLCNLHAKTHPKIAREQTEAGRYMGRIFYLPPEVQKWADLKTDNGGIPASGLALASHNDNGDPFPDIADLIEKHVEAL